MYETVEGLKAGLRELGLEEGKQFTLTIKDTKGNVKAAEEAAKPHGPAELLGWLAAQPAGNLKALLELLKSGEGLICDLIGPVRSYVEAGDRVDLSAIHTAGTDLAVASRNARQKVMDARS